MTKEQRTVKEQATQINGIKVTQPKEGEQCLLVLFYVI